MIQESFGVTTYTLIGREVPRRFGADVEEQVSFRPMLSLVLGQNANGKNGTDKMVLRKWYG